MKEKLRSKVLWGSIAAQVVAILIAAGKIDAGMGDTINSTLAGVMQILVTVGILNNPNDASRL